jgi:ubiquinone/menaquinone biosynthesis C-methylase UbiE
MSRFSCSRRAILTVLAVVLSTAVAAQQRNSDSREQWQKVDEIFNAMGISPGAVVADVGAGGGFFTWRLARAVGGEGRVYAVDINEREITNLRRRIDADGLANVEAVLGAADDPKLPPGTLDAALIINAYHEMTEHQGMLAKLRHALKRDGRLVIVEPISRSGRSRPRAEQVRQHEIGLEHVQQDARDAGFRIIHSEDPFTRRATGGGDEEWLLVLSPDDTASSTEPPESTAASPAIKAADWKAPELRIGVEEFKRLAAAGQVLVLDVRDAGSYAKGHLPGAALLTPEDIAGTNAAERLHRERRAIVTYCS